MAAGRPETTSRGSCSVCLVNEKSSVSAIPRLKVDKEFRRFLENCRVASQLNHKFLRNLLHKLLKVSSMAVVVFITD